MNKQYNVLAVSMSAILSLPVSASATVFEPSDGDVDTMAIQSFLSGYEFGVFDDADVADLNSATDFLVLQAVDAVTFTPDTGGYLLTDLNGDTLFLDGSASFVFGAREIGGSTWFTDTAFNVVNSLTRVFFADLQLPFAGGDAYLNVFDVKVSNGSTAVPIPASVWLFGSGLLGVGMIARRRKTGASPSPAVRDMAAA